MRRTIIATAVLLAGAAYAETRRVPSEYPTIQAGIDAALDGDVVLVADGVYTGEGNRELTIETKAITVRSENGPVNCVVDCERQGYGFALLGYDGSLVDGFTVTNARGHGVLALYAGVVIRNCIIEKNDGCPYTSGGGVSAASWPNSGAPRFEDCVIRNNTAASGAGVYASGGEFIRCIISNNHVCPDANDPVPGGGGVYMRRGQQAISTFVDCTIEENSAAHGGGVYIEEFGRGRLTRCIIVGNDTAYYGAGVHAHGAESQPSDLTVQDCIIVGNATPWYGGGVFARCDAPIFANCTIAGNIAGWAGGGIFGYDHATPVFQSTVVSGNSAELGAEIGLDVESAPRFSNSCIPNTPSWGWFDDASYIVWETPNGDADPLFVDADALDNDPLTWRDNDYGLSSASPCVDAGDPAVAWTRDRLLDVAGRVRVWDGDDDGAARVDIGALEYAAPCPGDADGDGVIGLADLARLLDGFGGPGGPQDGDTNADGQLSLEDLAMVLAAFGNSCH